MAVNVPPWPRVPHESALLLQGEGLPQCMAVRAEAIDGSPPSGFGASPTQPSPQCADASFRDGVQIDRRRLEIGVRARDQAAPRQCEDPSLEPGGIEREDEIDHRQARSNKERVAASLHEIL